MKIEPKTAAETINEDYAACQKCKPVAHLSLGSLDNLLGGIAPGKFHIVTGEPGAGKTAFCDQLKTELAAQGITVVYASYEVSSNRLFASSVSRLSCGSIKTNEVGHIEDPEKLAAETLAVEEYSKIGSRIININDSRVTALDIQHYLEDLVKTTPGETALIVDYIQMVPPEITRINTEERLHISEAANILRRIANDLNIIVFGISSLIRSAYGRSTTKLDLLSGSQTLEYNADSIMLLALDCKAEAREECFMLKNRPVSLSLIKNRYDALGVCKLTLHTEYSKFTERLADSC